MRGLKAKEETIGARIKEVQVEAVSSMNECWRMEWKV